MAILAGVIEDGSLVSEERWKIRIASFHREQTFTEKEQAIAAINKALQSAIQKRLPNKKFGILFSGGVDSTYIAYLCKRAGADFTCYTVGIEGSRDVEEARIAASDLGFSLKTKTLSVGDVEALIKEVIKILGKRDIVSVGVGATELAALRLAEEDGIDIVFGGLGSEEIFAGYERHAIADDVNAECWKGLQAMWERDLIRDYKIFSHEKMGALVPFLDKDVITAAMSVLGEWKIAGEQKKMILREAAIRNGLPERFAMRRKMAAQYGSGIDKAIARLAKKHGFATKGEYLTSL